MVYTYKYAQQARNSGNKNIVTTAKRNYYHTANTPKYPQISLTEARTLRDKALNDIQHDIDPAKVKRREKLNKSNTFGQ